MALAVTFTARGAATQPDTARSTDGSGGAPTPKNTSTGISVSFDPSAENLPQDEIRAAVARELEHRPDDGSAVSGDFNVSVEGGHIVVRFKSPQSYTERVLPVPEEREQIPVMLGLLAGNLARDQAAAVRPKPVAPAPPPPPLPLPHRAKPIERPGPVYSRHLLGIHVAQDFLFVGGQNVCDPYLGQADDNYTCVYAGTDEAFFHRPSPSTDGVTNTVVAATTRLLLSYDFAVSPRFTLGLRAGYAFRGGPAAGQVPGVTGSGTPFMPGHIELRASYWLVPLTHRPWHAFLGVGGGLAQVDGKVSHSVVDCEEMEAEHPGSVEGETFRTCTGGTPINGQTTTELDAWKKTGLGFVAVNGGAMLDLNDYLAATLDVSVLLLMPASGVSLQPSLGVVYTP